MQVLKVIRYDLRKAIKDDWNVFLCWMRTGHKWRRAGTVYDIGKADLEKGTIQIGRLLYTVDSCELCRYASRRRYARKGDGLRYWLRRHLPFHHRKLDGGTG